MTRNRANPASASNARRRAMTVFELVLSLVVIAAMLGAACRVSGMLREDNSELDTRVVLRTLQDALQTYHDLHDTWPPAPTHDAISALLAEPKTDAAVRELEPLRDSVDQWVIRDGFGKPVRYLVPAPGSSAEPDFVSAGRDGRFGNVDRLDAELDSDLADNLYGVDQNSYTADSESPLP